MSKKAIRVQIDMLYQVEDSHADEVYEQDVGFFYQIKEDFNKWGDNKADPRTPLTFDLRHTVGPVEDEEE